MHGYALNAATKTQLFHFKENHDELMHSLILSYARLAHKNIYIC